MTTPNRDSTGLTCSRGHVATAGARFCGECGERLATTATRAPQQVRSTAATGSSGVSKRWLLALSCLSGALLLVAAASLVVVWQQGGTLREQRSTLQALDRRVASIADRVRDTEQLAQQLGGRMTRVESDSAGELDADSLAKRSLDSVFTIESTTGLGVSQGSGFVAGRLGRDSVIITNYHVVEDAYLSSGQVRVLQGDRTFEASIMRVSAAEDIAALRVYVALPALPLADGTPRVGEEILVLGSPIGLEQSVSTGVVAAIRSDEIQFTAPVSHGSSGGPVLNADGEVIGISTSGVRGDVAQGIFFAVASQTICDTVLRCG